MDAISESKSESSDSFLMFFRASCVSTVSINSGLHTFHLDSHTFWSASAGSFAFAIRIL